MVIVGLAEIKMEAVLLANERQALLERFLPRSQGHIAVQCESQLSLENGQRFEVLAVSRTLSFVQNEAWQNIGIFFCENSNSTDMLNYQMEYGLELDGEVWVVREISWAMEAGERVGTVKEYGRDRFQDTEDFGAAVARADSYLSLLNRNRGIVQLPKSHPLLLTVRADVSLRQ